MNATTTQPNWASLLKLFSEQNSSRPTRLGVFKDENGTMTDYWIENGLPLLGIAANNRGENFTIEIMLGDTFGDGMRHLTHMVKNAQVAKIVFNAAGTEDGLEIEDAEGKTTILKFEN